MKRIVCLLTVLMLLAVVLTGCQSDTIPIATAKGAKIDAALSDITEIECLGSVNGEKDFSLKGDEAVELFKRIRSLTKSETKDTEPSSNVIHISFTGTFNGEKAWLGVYMVQDNGIIMRMTAPYDAYMRGYSCDKSTYETILKLVQP